MSKYTLRGVEVEFPYAEAYGCQLAYMEKVIEALQEVRKYSIHNDLSTLHIFPPPLLRTPRQNPPFFAWSSPVSIAARS